MRKVNKLDREPIASTKSDRHYTDILAGHQAGASSDWQPGSSLFLGQAGDKPRAVQHLARDAEGKARGASCARGVHGRG